MFAKRRLAYLCFGLCALSLPVAGIAGSVGAQSQAAPAPSPISTPAFPVVGSSSGSNPDPTSCLPGASPSDLISPEPLGYFTITGMVQGPIEGPGAMGVANAIPLFSFSFPITVPVSTGTGTGAGAGRVSYSPIRLTTSLDRAAPNLFQAIATNETLKSVVITLVRSVAGKTVTYQTITLTNASLSSLTEYNECENTYQDLSIAFQRIMISSPPADSTFSGGAPVTS